MKNIVSQEWLIDNMSNENLIILDARAQLTDHDYGIKEYEKGHIKGARFISLKDVMSGKPSAHGGRNPLPNMDRFIEDMKNVGINDDSLILIYDDGDIQMAARLWWMLKYCGKKDVYILEGGIKQWLDNKYEISTELPQVERSNSLSLNINNSMEVDIDYVRAAIDRDNIAIIDVRASERYMGLVEPYDRIPGHIPSSLNLPWMDLVVDGKVMDREDVVKYFEPLQKYDELIVHCGSGITGAVTYIFMDEIGLKPRLYVGGYSDWSSYEENEVVKEKV